MFKKVNAREKLIGWYHSGPKLRASDLEINELFKRYTPNPLLVIVDVQPKEVGVPTDAYFAVEEIKDVSRTYVCYGPSMKLTTKSKFRTAQRQPKLLCIHPLRSKPKRPKRSVSSTFYATSVMSPLAPSQPALPPNYNPSRASISASVTSVSTYKKSLTGTCRSTMPFLQTCKTFSISYRTLSPRRLPQRQRQRHLREQ